MSPTSHPTGTPLRRAVRRVAVTVAGGAVVAAGVAMLVLPGPGLVTIALGLSLLGREHAWAAALEQRARARVAAAARHVGRSSRTARSRRRAGSVRPLPDRHAAATADRHDRAA